MARSQRSRFTKIILTLAVIGASAAAGYRWTVRPDQAPEFSTTTIARGDLVQTVVTSGDIQAVTSVDVSSQVSGQITEVTVNYNAPIKAGQVIAKIDPATYEQLLKQAEANLAAATVATELARSNAARTRGLREKNLVAQQELDQMEAQLAQAEASLLTRRAAVRDAEINLARCTIYAPMDGIVIDKLTEVGKTVAARLNAPTLFTIVDSLADLHINAAVSEADIGYIEPGQAVTFTVGAYPGRQFRGTVAQIRNAPKTNQNVVTYQVVIDVKNADLKLKPGMTANVTIVVAERRNVPKIANSALRARIPDEMRPGREAIVAAIRTVEPQSLGEDANGGRPSRSARTVFKMVGSDPKTARLEPYGVKLGISDGVHTEVLGGVREGDVLVTAVTLPGAPALAPGAQPANPFVGRQRGGGGGGHDH